MTTDARLWCGTVKPSSYLQESGRASLDAGGEPPTRCLLPQTHHACIFLSGHEDLRVHGPRGRDAVLTGLVAESMNPSAGEKGLCVCPAAFG